MKKLESLEDLVELCKENGIELLQDKESEASDFKSKVSIITGPIWAIIKARKLEEIEIPTYFEFSNKIYLDFIGDKEVFIGKSKRKQFFA